MGITQPKANIMHYKQLIAILLLSTAVGAAEEGFDIQRRPLNEALKARTLDAAAVVPFERLVQFAVTDDQRAEAAAMLAEALERAGLFERASTQWGACAELERKRHPADRTQRVWNCEQRRLKAMTLIKPAPREQIITLGEQLLQQTDPVFSSQQKLQLIEIVAFLIRGAGYSLDQYKAEISWLTKQAAQATAEGDYRFDLLLLLAHEQYGLNLGADAEATYDRILADPQLKPAEHGYVLLHHSHMLERHEKNKEALALAKQALDEYSPAWHDEWSKNYWALNFLRGAGSLARQKGDLVLAEKLLDLLCTFHGTMELDAKLELAAVRCAQQRWADADAQYAELIASKQDPRITGLAQFNRAFLIYRDLGDSKRGLPMIEESLQNVQVPFRTRADAVMAEARRLLAQGDHVGALAWYSRIEGLPGGNGSEMPQLLSQALVAMGQIAGSQNDAKSAKGYYQHALDLTGGDRVAVESARKALQEPH